MPEQPSDVNVKEPEVSDQEPEVSDQEPEVSDQEPAVEVPRDIVWTEVVGMDPLPEYPYIAHGSDDEEGTEPDEEKSGEASPAGEEHEEGVSYGLADGDYEQIAGRNDDERSLSEVEERIRKRQEEKDEKTRRSKVRFWSILAAALLALGFFLLTMTGVFTVEYIEVRGNSYFTSEEIINIGHAVPGKNLIYHPEKKEIVGYLVQNPYIKSAKVRRKLPSTLVIEVEERKEACIFRYDDDFLVLDSDGVLLKKTRTEPQLTVVSGMVVNKIKLGEVIGTTDPGMFNNTMRILRAMEDGDMYFIRIEMGEEKSVRAYIYESFLVKGTCDTLVENLENGHLHMIVEKLFDDDITRGSIILNEDGTASFQPGLK
jgi:cell division protein FtsQ